MGTSSPLVSVCLITYNHVDYIKQAIDGVLIQNVNFTYELIIADDFSSDGTRNVLLEYKEKNPNLIKLILQKKNVGAEQNWQTLLLYPKSKYIAYLEGDDYWIDPFKLQKQFDLLELYPEYGMICTNYHKLYQNRNYLKKNCFSFPRYKYEVSFEDYILDRSTLGSATVMFRKELMNNYFNDIKQNVRSNWNVGDTPMWLYFSLKSKIKVMPEVTAVYRILSSSACHFETPDEHYAFVMKGFEVPDYFLSHFNVSNKVKLLNEQKKLKATLLFAFETNNKTLFFNNFRKIKELDLPIPKKFILLKLGMYNSFFHLIVKLVLSII